MASNIIRCKIGNIKRQLVTVLLSCYYDNFIGDNDGRVNGSRDGGRSIGNIKAEKASSIARIRIVSSLNPAALTARSSNRSVPALAPAVVSPGCAIGLAIGCAVG